jgi:hypothetical protein
MTHSDKKRFYSYLAYYLAEELDRDMVLDANTIQNAVDAFESTKNAVVTITRGQQ